MVQPSLKLLAAAVRAAPRLRKAPIQLTDAAAERIRDLLSRREKVLALSSGSILISKHRAPRSPVAKPVALVCRSTLSLV